MAQAETPHAAPGRGVHRHPCNTCGCLVWGHFLYSRSQLNEDDGRLRPAPGLCVLHTGSASGTARPWCVLFPAPFRTQALTVGRSCGAPSHGLLLPGHAFLPLPVPMSVPRPLLPLPPQACGEHPVLGASSFPPAALLHLVRGMEAAGNFHFIIEAGGFLWLLLRSAALFCHNSPRGHCTVTWILHFLGSLFPAQGQSRMQAVCLFLLLLYEKITVTWVA
ncbi:uncharacterized protein LOC104854393 isoform X1 [Fukomys damarensis]|uniref:uncharacterized protein LOC104854393 isoform X1 n=1 Tax=Fukomys damarensis TaxID=885580 RepID=UPI00053FF2BE|nr:uncharacterized protein LOC104854393 isoform X1 [Fukomys damarensis]